MKYKLAIFDMDGTLISSRPFHASVFYDFLRENWSEVSYQKCYDAVGITVKKVFETVGVPEKYHNDFFERLMDYYYEKADQFLCKTTIARGIPELLQKMRQDGVKTAICTNSLNEVVNMFMKYHGLREEFDVIRGADPKSHSKVERCIDIQKVLEIETKDVLFIGDSEGDIELANEMGYDSVYAGTEICWAADDQYIVNVLKPTYVVRTYEEFLNKIKQGEI